MQLQAGARVDHYTLIEMLGEGGQGSVWKVLDPRDGGVVRALKLVSLAKAGAASFDRARREARILAASDHPALVACHGLFEDPRAGLVGLVMDLVAGGSLGEAHKAGRVDRGRAAAALAQLAEALAYIHRAGLVHRDLKPDNVLLTEGFFEDPHRTGTVKLVDFGIAAPVGNPDQLTATGAVIGTLAYLAPELVDPASWGSSEGAPRDVFAFGVLSHQLLCGHHPTGLGPRATMIDYARAYKAAEAGRIPWPGGPGSGPVGGPLDGPWGAITAACLALRHAERPQDGAAILGMLRGAAGSRQATWTGMPGTPPPPSTRTEPMETSPTAPRVVERTGSMHAAITSRTPPATPRLAPAPAAPPRQGSGLATGIVIGIVLAATAVALYVLGGPASLGGPSAAQAPSASPAPPPPAALLPAVPPTPTPAPSDAACRNVTEGIAFDPRATRFACPPCEATIPALPSRAWQMRVVGVTDPFKAHAAKQLCMAAAGADEVCVPFSRMPDWSGAGGRLRVTTQDIEAGRLLFRLRDRDGTLAEGPGRRRSGKPPFLTSALCHGLSLVMDAPGGALIHITVYLDER